MARYASIGIDNIKAIHNCEYIVDRVDIPIELQDKNIAELQAMTKIRDGKIISKNATPKKVALISNHKMKCGIATYFSSLCSEMLPMLPDYKLFIERNDNPTSSIYELDGYTIPEDKVVACWKRGEPLTSLMVAVREYDPDVVIINHEYGIFPQARYWLSLITQLSDYRTITILHSVFPHHQDKVVVEASVKEAVVHLDGAKQALINKGVSGKIHVIPHGCYTADQTPLWNIYGSKHTVIQIGFGLHYKHFETSIETVALLKDKYPDIYFTGIFSETDFNAVEHQTYYNELIALIDRLGVVNNVGLVRGFQSDPVISAYMRTNAVCLLPYGSPPQHEVYGASGAARLAMAHGIPVITSTFHHFEDLPTIKADGAEACAKELERLFESKEAREEQVKRQNAHVSAHSWDAIAKRYVELIMGT